MTTQLPPSDEQIAARRNELHLDDPSRRPLSKDSELVGVRGERAFGEMLGLEPDATDRPRGDGGVDFRIPIGVDVKTARKPYNLLVEVGEVRAHVYVLAGYDDATGEVRFIGWTTFSVVLAAPTREFGHGILNHYVPADRLQPIDRLVAFLRGPTI